MLSPATNSLPAGTPGLPDGHAVARVATNKNRVFVASKEGGYFTLAGAKWVELTFVPAALK
jgi:hypothetical protein